MRARTPPGTALFPRSALGYTFAHRSDSPSFHGNSLPCVLHYTVFIDNGVPYLQSTPVHGSLTIFAIGRDNKLRLVVRRMAGSTDNGTATASHRNYELPICLTNKKKKKTVHVAGDGGLLPRYGPLGNANDLTGGRARGPATHEFFVQETCPGCGMPWFTMAASGSY